MVTVKVEMYFEIENEESMEEIKKLEHHAERLLDLDSYPEIHSVYGVTVTEIENNK